jgi:hypothetical protein
MNRMIRTLTVCFAFLVAACGGDDDEQNIASVRVDPANNSPTAGATLAVTVTALTAEGTPAASFVGTIRLTSSDAQAVLPGDISFTAADAGVKQVSVTLKTAGLSTLTGSDTAVAARSGTASVTVRPAAAATCTMSQAPAAMLAGATVGVSVIVLDAFANVATGYAGTIKLTASDPRAVLPADATYAAGDAGRRAFSASLVTTGTQTLTATDTGNTAIRCEAQITVAAGVPRLVLTLPSDANAGFPVTVGVAVKDPLGNPIPGYTGTVTFTSTDAGAGAAAPAPITFTGSEGGVASTTATFVTLGAQTLSATDAGTLPAAGSAVATVHGLVYTGPTSGKVQLVLNTAQSNTQVVQLDMVATQRLEVSSFFGGGPGSFATGMNLPLDTNRVTGDATLFTAGNALAITPAPPNPPILPVAVARIGDDHVLYTAVSRRRVAGAVFNQLTEVQAGRVFYSIRLRLTQNGTVGPVFDGAQPAPLFRASVRDQYGDDFVNQADFGIGKLEIR